MAKTQKNHINCSEMLNAIQERKRCNRLVTIPWRNTIPFQGLIGDHFGVDVERNGDHFGVDLGVISGLGIISGSGSFRGLYRTSYQIGVHAIPDTLFLAQEPYRAGLLFTDNNDDFGAISVTVWIYAAPSLQWITIYRKGVHNLTNSSLCRHEKLSGIL